YLRIAEVQGGGAGPNLGQVDKAMVSFDKARKMASAALASAPDNLQAGITYVALNRALSYVYTIKPDRQQVRRTLNEGIRVGERLLMLYPSSDRLRFELATL